MQRGTVEANSKGLSHGSEFIVRLPVLNSAPLGLDVAPQERAKRSEKSGRVLVVDDNTDAADAVAILLGAAGHDVRVAYSANSALQTALEYRPDVVLLDIGLPEMDGYEVARRLRQQSELRHTKLIALTGYGQETDRQQSKEAGFEFHLVKPVDAGTLQELLEKLMKSDSE